MRLCLSQRDRNRFNEPVHDLTWGFERVREDEGRSEASMPSFTRS